MSHFSSPDEALKHRNRYLKVFASLAILTVVTVAIALFGIKNAWPIPFAVSIGLLIALTKGSLVAAVFMHLTTEGRWLFLILAICIIFFFALMLLPVLTDMDNPMILRSH